MKPLGTITIYYDFIDSSSRKVLESITSEARNYHDFVVRLGAFVCATESSTTLTHLAAVLAFEIRNSETTENIAVYHGNNPLVRPWIYPICSRGDRLSIQDKVEIAVEKAKQTEPEDWILLELHIMKAYSLILTPEGSNALDAAKDLAKEHPKFHCFSPYLHHIEARILHQEGAIEDAIKICDEGIQIAKEYENDFELARLLAWRGIATTSFNAMAGLNYLERAYEIVERLGSEFHMNAFLLEMAEVSTILGEYDLALEYHKKASQTYSIREGPNIENALFMSQLYNDLGNAKEALTWAKWAHQKFIDAGSDPDINCLCTMAWCLLLLEKLDNAQEIIDKARSQVLKSGNENDLAFCHFVSGLHEQASGDFETSLLTLEEALLSYKRVKTQVFIARTLLAFVKT